MHFDPHPAAQADDAVARDRVAAAGEVEATPGVSPLIEIAVRCAGGRGASRAALPGISASITSSLSACGRS